MGRERGERLYSAEGVPAVATAVISWHAFGVAGCAHVPVWEYSSVAVRCYCTEPHHRVS